MQLLLQTWYLWPTSTSADRFLHKRTDPCLIGSRQLFQRESDRPHSVFIEICRRVEAEHHVSIIVRRLWIHPEVAHDFSSAGISGQAIPGFRRKVWRTGFDDSMEPLAHGTIWLRHLGNGC